MSVLCYGCMQSLAENPRFCPYCGYDQQAPAESGLYITPGTELNGYKFGRVLGHGGFGITYIGQHIPSGEMVAIKEFYPNGMAGRTATQTVSAYAQKADAFQLGLEKFRQEAQLIGQFNDFPGIVDSRDYFEAMGTGYFVMEYIEGVTVKDYVAQQGGRVSFQAVKAILMPIMDALSEMHRHNIIHRDISPENIYITKDKRVKLLDFGAARFANAQDNHSMSIILKHGYAPKEQYYTKGSQGPWTDVYAVAATAYYMLTGQTPQSCIERIEQDHLVAPSRIDGDIGFIEEQVLMVALSINEIDRYQTMSSFQKALLRIETTSSQDIMQQVQSGQITQSQPEIVHSQPSPTPAYSGNNASNPSAPLKPSIHQNSTAFNASSSNAVLDPKPSLDWYSKSTKDKKVKPRKKSKKLIWIIATCLIALGIIMSIPLTHYLKARRIEQQYQLGLDYYQKRDYAKAMFVFEQLEDYKDINQYAYLFVVHYLNGDMSTKPHDFFEERTGLNLDEYDGEKLYQDILSLNDFADAEDLLMSNFLIYYFLVGEWEYSAYVFEMSVDTAQSNSDPHPFYKSYSYHTNLPEPEGQHFTIRSQIIYLGTENSEEKESLKVKYIDYDTIDLYVYNSDKSYTFTRQK